MAMTKRTLQIINFHNSQLLSEPHSCIGISSYSLLLIKGKYSVFQTINTAVVSIADPNAMYAFTVFR